MGLDRLIYNSIRNGNISLANFADNIPLNFGSDKDVAVQWTGSLLTVIPLTDDTGAINIGNGTKDIDLKIFLGTTGKWAKFDVGNSNFETNGIPLKLHNHETTGEYAIQLRTEYNAATGAFFGMDCEVHSMISRTAGGMRGLSMTGRVTAGTTISGTADILPGYFLLDVDGTIDASGGLFAALVAKVDAGGTFTAVGHLCSLWLDSLQSGPVAGSHQLAYMTNNGNCKLDQAFYIYGGTAAQGIAALFEFEACTGAQNFLGDKVDADVAYAHYRKLMVTVDGNSGWIYVEMAA